MPTEAMMLATSNVRRHGSRDELAHTGVRDPQPSPETSVVGETGAETSELSREQQARAMPASCVRIARSHDTQGVWGLCFAAWGSRHTLGTAIWHPARTRGQSRSVEHTPGVARLEGRDPRRLSLRDWVGFMGHAAGMS